MASLNLKLAGEVVKKIEALWQLFRVPQEPEQLRMLVESWAKALARQTYPEQIYLDSVDLLFASSRSGDSPPMPMDVLEACKRAVREAEADPSRAAGIQRWREMRQEMRDNALLACRGD